MPRQLCNNCQYPIDNCLCDHLTNVTHKTKVIVLQHPSEVKNAKNTVRLLNLISDNFECYVGETEQDFSEIKQRALQSPEQYALLFPAEDSEDIAETAAKSFSNLIVLDGTWKKAKKILLCNPWLTELITVTFSEEKVSEYQIRSTSVAGGLSTIEAVAYSLDKIENCDTTPFIRALNGLKHSFTKRMPKQVKARYQQRE